MLCVFAGGSSCIRQSERRSYVHHDSASSVHHTECGCHLRHSQWPSSWKRQSLPAYGAGGILLQTATSTSQDQEGQLRFIFKSVICTFVSGLVTERTARTVKLLEWNRRILKKTKFHVTRKCGSFIYCFCDWMFLVDIFEDNNAQAHVLELSENKYTRFQRESPWKITFLVTWTSHCTCSLVVRAFLTNEHEDFPCRDSQLVSFSKIRNDLIVAVVSFAEAIQRSGLFMAAQLRWVHAPFTFVTTTVDVWNWKK